MPYFKNKNPDKLEVVQAVQLKDPLQVGEDWSGMPVFTRDKVWLVVGAEQKFMIDQHFRETYEEFNPCPTPSLSQVTTPALSV